MLVGDGEREFPVIGVAVEYHAGVQLLLVPVVQGFEIVGTYARVFLGER